VEERFSAFPSLSVSDVYVARVDAGERRRAGSVDARTVLRFFV